MGIRGLHSWIRWTAAEQIKQPIWEQFHNKKIGIDILGFLYKAKAHKIHVVHYLGEFIVRCRMYGIIPIPVFDGKPPDEKRPMLNLRAERREEASIKAAKLISDIASIRIPSNRREVIENEIKRLEYNSSYLTSDERNLAKQFFYSCGIVSFNANGEADNVLAYLSRRGFIDAVISNDFDLLTRGVENLLVPQMYALPGDKSGWTVFSLSSILKSVSFTYEQFVEMCILMGCDYLPKEYSKPYRMAYWSIKYHGDMEKIVKESGYDIQKYLIAKSILVGNEETPEKLMGDKQWEKWWTYKPKVEPDTLNEFQNLYLSDFTEREMRLLLTV